MDCVLHVALVISHKWRREKAVRPVRMTAATSIVLAYDALDSVCDHNEGPVRTGVSLRGC